jgi:hypothetical protein
MKHHTRLLLPLLLLAGAVRSQVAITPSGASPYAEAMLDIVSTGKGLLIPRMSSTDMQQLGAPGGPAAGMWIFNSTENAFYFYNGSIWKKIGEAPADGDGSPTNELQNLGSSASGTNRTVTISGGTGTTFSVADNDNDSFNEIQTLSRSGTTVTLSNGGGSVSVDDGDASATNELQTLGSAANGTDRTLSISGGNSVTFSVADGDNDASNELDSKWSEGAFDRIHVSSGSVGIGWPQPAQKLDLNGRIRIRFDSPADGKVLTARNTSGDTDWRYPSVLEGSAHSSLEDYISPGAETWGEFNTRATVDNVQAGDRFLVIASFRCSLKGNGSGSDDFRFRIGARKNSSGATIWSTADTGWIETIDQHRDKWHAFQFHRVMTLDQAGFTYFYIETGLTSSDDTLYADDIHISVIRL